MPAVLSSFRPPRCAYAASCLIIAALVLAACGTPTVPGERAPAQATRDDGLQQQVPFPPRDRGDVSLSLPAEQTVDERRKVALLIPLTGSAAGSGRDLMDAAQMALFDIADDDFVLLPHDTGANQQTAAAAAAEALDAGAELILGPLLASTVEAVAPLARQREVPVIAFSNDRVVAGDGAFVMGFLPADQVSRVVEYARSQGLTRFAAVAPENTYGRAMVSALEQSAFSAAAAVSDVTYYEPGSAELPDIVRNFADYDVRRTALLEQREALEGREDAIAKQALRRLEGRETIGDVEFDAVLLPAGGSEVLQLAPLLAFYDVDPARVKLLGTWLWDDAALGNEPTMVGAWFAAPPPNAREDFVTRFEELYGRVPDRRATLAYDAVALAAILSRQRADDAFSIPALTTPNGFVGMDGIFRLMPTGEVQRGLSVLEIRRSGFKELDPAPTTFEEFLN